MPGCRGAAISGWASCASSACWRTGSRRLPNRSSRTTAAPSRPSASGSGGRRRGTCSRRSSCRPATASLKASLRYCEGHLHRIDGEAEKLRRRTAAANQHFTEAVSAFREAAELRRDWPDPFLGLARTFIYGLEDIDRAADAMRQAQKSGYSTGDRETAQLGDGYRARGDALWQTARRLADMPQEAEYLLRATQAYRQALALYERVPGFSGVALNLRRTRRRARVRLRCADVGAREHVEGPERTRGMSDRASPMAITYTTAAERDVRRAHHRRWSAAPLDPALTGASVLAALLMFAAYQGAFAFSRTGDIAAPVVNLNTVADPQALETVFEPVCRCRAIGGWPPGSCSWFLVQADGARRTVPNVGAIARVRVPEAHDRSRPDRSGVSRSPARGARPRGRRGDRRSALGAAADLRAACGDQAVLDRPGPRIGPRACCSLWGALYLIAFHAVFAAWRWRGLRGDRVLLAAAHVLTAVGFAAMVSRPDPLRDLLLFVRYAEGVVAGLTVAVAGVVFQPSNRQPAKPQLSAAARRVRAVVSPPRPRDRIGAVRAATRR